MAFKASRARTRAVELERKVIFPLRICCLEQIDLWYRSGNIKQNVDSSKRSTALLTRISAD
jgi:hypothetical protein